MNGGLGVKARSIYLPSQEPRQSYFYLLSWTVVVRILNVADKGALYVSIIMKYKKIYMANKLTQSDIHIIGECLNALSKGPFIDDWEFETVCGVDRDEMLRVANDWPYVDGHDDVVNTSIASSMGSLFAYPHQREEELKRRVSVSREEIIAVAMRWHEARTLTNERTSQ